MLEAQLLRPYLAAVLTTREARLALVNAIKGRPFRRAYQAAIRAHTEACILLARHVDRLVGGIC
ncbi:hypothetical protein ACYZTX_00510 [Pseudomonas sp. MDT1-17]